MVKLHTSYGAFEYTGCNRTVTVEQLKRHLRFVGIEFGSRILKHDLCHIINRLQKQIQQVRNGKKQGIPIINFLDSQTQQQKKIRLNCSSCGKPKQVKPKKQVKSKKKYNSKKQAKIKKTVMKKKKK